MKAFVYSIHEFDKPFLEIAAKGNIILCFLKNL